MAFKVPGPRDRAPARALRRDPQQTALVALFVDLEACLGAPRRFVAFESIIFASRARLRGGDAGIGAAVFELSALGLDWHADRAFELSEILSKRGLKPVIRLLSLLRLPVALPETSVLFPDALSTPIGWPEERFIAAGPVPDPAWDNVLNFNAMPNTALLLPTALGFLTPQYTGFLARVPAYECGETLRELDSLFSSAQDSPCATLACLLRSAQAEVDSIRKALSRLPHGASFLDFNRRCEPFLAQVRRLYTLLLGCVGNASNAAFLVDFLFSAVDGPRGNEFQSLLDAALQTLHREVDGFLLQRPRETSDFFASGENGVPCTCLRMPKKLGGDDAVKQFNAAGRRLDLGFRLRPVVLQGATPKERLLCALNVSAAETVEHVHALFNRILLYGEDFDDLLAIKAISDKSLAFLRLGNTTVRAVCAASKAARDALFACERGSLRRRWLQVHFVLRQLEAHLLDTLAYELLPGLLRRSDAATDALEDFAVLVLRLTFNRPEDNTLQGLLQRLLAVAHTSELAASVWKEFETSKKFVHRLLERGL